MDLSADYDDLAFYIAHALYNAEQKWSDEPYVKADPHRSDWVGFMEEAYAILDSYETYRMRQEAKRAAAVYL